MLRRRVLRVGALSLATILGLSATGIPSHSHREDGPGAVLVDAHHHGHGVQLVAEQERLISSGTLIAATTSDLVLAEPAPALALWAPPISAVIPQGRAPPTNRSRAPPYPI